MNRTLILVGVLASTAFVALAPCAVANTAWYVDAVHGSDGNNCKSAPTACKTIGHAISLASSGDSVFVAGAPNNEHLSVGIAVNVIATGAAATTIDANAAGRADAIPSAGTADSQPLPVDLLQEPLAMGFGSQASANACFPLGHSCTRGLTGQCCTGSMCGYRNTCCDRPLRNEICASNAECCSSNFCYNHRCM